MLRRIPAVVDPNAPWQEQVRQAIEAWIGYAESQPAITLSWVREVPSLSVPTCRQDMTDAFVGMIQRLCDTKPMRAAGIGPVPRELAVMLLGGLRELAATAVEDGGRIGDVSEAARREARQNEVVHAVSAQHRVEVAAGECAAAPLRDDDLAGQRRDVRVDRRVGVALDPLAGFAIALKVLLRTLTSGYPVRKPTTI